MTDALVSIVLEQLIQPVNEEVKLVVGVTNEVKKLTSNLTAIQAVVDDAEKKQVNDVPVRDWLDKLRDVTYDIDDTLDEWSTAILKLRIDGDENAPIPKNKVYSFIFSPCFCFRQVTLRRDIARKIKHVNKRLDVIAKEKERYNFSQKIGTEEPERPTTTSFVDVSEVQGRDEDKKTIIKQLLDEGNEQNGSLRTISIVGLGGIGKTTLAQLAYNHNEVMVHFQKRIWVCVSDPFDKIRVAKAILEELGVPRPELAEFQTLLRNIHDSIKEQKFLLVLDDVWTEDRKKWESFELSLKSGARGSRILVTTRNEKVAKMMHTTYTNHLELLSRENCWSLFSHIAFFERSEEEREKLEEIGRALVEKCKGLPLAAKALGSLMFVKESIQEWQNVLESEIWSQKVVGEELSPVLLLSYYDLPPPIKRCFSYCAVFPKDTKIKRDYLIQLWMAQGYLGSDGNAEMEITGREYFMNLAMRSFFQEFEKDKDDGSSIIGCKMHDIMHDLAQFVTKNECSIMEVGGVNEGGMEMESCCAKARHSTLTIDIEARVSSPISFCNAKNLRTLLIHKHSWFASIHGITDLIRHLTCVRALNLSGCSLKEVPMEIGKLIHLRYLNLSSNYELERLPETVCDLHNLQTLNLEGCSRLEKLPQGMGKLINLRHIVVDSKRMKEIPKGIDRLSYLRTLERFIVSGGKDCSKLGDLEKLNHLRVLGIQGLKNVADGSEVEKAKLKNKKHLQVLHLDFSQGDNRVSEEGRMMDNDVLEALQPPPGLELLMITAFNGSTVSSSFILTLTKLRKLQFYNWPKCERLPPLGKLPFLESLVISGMSVVKTVGVEFLGISLDDGCISQIVAFPKLKHLYFGSMHSWEEWDVPASASRRVTLMPLLLSLQIWYCDNLKALPNHLSQMTNLKHLEIGKCPILKQRCRNGTGEDCHKISHIPSINIIE